MTFIRKSIRWPHAIKETLYVVILFYYFNDIPVPMSKAGMHAKCKQTGEAKEQKLHFISMSKIVICILGAKGQKYCTHITLKSAFKTNY